MTAATVLSPVDENISQSRPTQTRSSILYGTLVLLLFGPLAFGAADPWGILILETGSALLFTAWTIDQIQSGALQVKHSPLFSPMAAFGLLIALQLFTGRTASREATLSAAMLFTCYGILCFLLTQCLRRTWQIRRSAAIFTAYGAGMAVFAIVQSLSSNGKIYWFVAPRFGGWIFGSYVNHNHYAGLMEMLTPIALLAALSRNTARNKRWLTGAAAIVMGISILLSGSRGGTVAFVVQILILAVIVGWRKVDKLTIGLVIALAVTILGLFTWLAGPELQDRLTNIATTPNALQDQMRLRIAQDTFRMFEERPIFGWGMGTFTTVEPQFRSFPTDLVVDHADNDYLQLLVETGLIGFGIAIWFLIVAIRGAVRKIRRDHLHTNGLVGVAALLGIIGILVHSLVDFNLEIPANAAFFYSLCALASLDSRFGMHHRIGRPVP